MTTEPEYPIIRVDYAGPGGTCEGMRMLGLEPVGIEWEAAACATRAAAGHLTIRADLDTYRPHHRRASLDGYSASPPCQTFSAGGKKAGREAIGDLCQAIDQHQWGESERFDSRTRHVLHAARNAFELAPTWIFMEQVVDVLPVWGALGQALEGHGYSVWVGVLCAADYGVPQTRKRAILMASLEREVHPPKPTRMEGAWESMDNALGLKGMGLTLDRRNTSRGKGGGRVPVACVDTSRPAPTLTGAALKGQWVFRPVDNLDHMHHSMTLAEGAALQGFPADYPWRGRTRDDLAQQIGNAVPPRLSAHVVGALTGREVPPVAAPEEDSR